MHTRLFGKRQVLAFRVEPSYVRFRLRLARYPHMVRWIEIEASKRKTIRLLDVGCGKGRLRLFAKHLISPSAFARIEWHGTDNDVIKAKRSKEERGYEHISLSDIQTGIPYSDSYFDIVVCSHVLEHLHSPESAAKELSRVLKADGLLILGSPIYTPISSVMRRIFLPILNFYWHIAKGKEGGHKTFFSLRKLLSLFPNFQPIEIKGFRTPFSTIPFLVFLEDFDFYYHINSDWGATFPSLTPEINLIARCKK